MSIYTKTGDGGLTSLGNGQRISKSSAVIDFVGSLDELNSELGICAANLEEVPNVDFTEEIEVLQEIQRDLFIVGAVATGAKMEFRSAAEVVNIEKTIDDYERLLPKLNNFILPGGTTSAAAVHYARTLVRRIERNAVSLKSDSIKPFLPYLNRLSDLLFVMARYINHKQKVQEEIWKN